MVDESVTRRLNYRTYAFKKIFFDLVSHHGSYNYGTKQSTRGVKMAGNYVNVFTSFCEKDAMNCMCLFVSRLTSIIVPNNS